MNVKNHKTATSSPAPTLIAVICLALVGCGEVGEQAPPTLDEFRASLAMLDGDFIVEGDLVLHGEGELRAYYDKYVNPSEVEIVTGPLAINQWNGGDDGYSHGTQKNLTYCVSTTFNANPMDTRQATLAAAIATAAANWEAVLDVDFTYNSGQDGSCNGNNANVWFDVRPSGVNDGWTYAFFPHDARGSREVKVGGMSGGAALMTHELGHILGFRHEHGRSEYTGPGTCAESGARNITSYDAASVMHYPSTNSCPGTAGTYAISPTDTLGAQRIFGARLNTPKLASQDTCEVFAATAENRTNTSGSRFDMCRWASKNTPALCAPTRGIWTTAGSTFAQNNPGAVPAGQAGACITQVSNLACGAADDDKCLLNGGTCERQLGSSGQIVDLCRWHRARTQAACSTTRGIWTASSSSFATSVPKCVPPGWAGACITQPSNL